MGRVSAVKYLGSAPDGSGHVVGIRMRCWHPDATEPPPLACREFYFDDQHSLVCLFAGYGFSKTHTGAMWAARKLLTNRNKVGGAVAPTMSHVERVMIPALLLALNECWEVVYANGKTGPIPYKLNRSSSNMRLEVPMLGSSVEFTYADKDNLKGQNWRWAWGDEPGIWDDDVWPSFLARVRATVTDEEAERTGAFRQIALTGTPEGYNWLYYETVGKDTYAGCDRGEHPTVRVWFGSTRQATWLPEDWLERLMEQYPADLLEEKIEGKFLPVGKGQVYTFDRRLHVRPCEFDPNYPLTFTMDWGVAPIVAVVHQTRPDPENPKKRITYALDEVHFARGDISNIVQKLVATWGSKVKNVTTGEQRHRIICCGDATGKTKNATGTQAWGDFYARLASYGLAYTEAQLGSNPPVSDRVAVANAIFDHKGYFIDPRCKHLIRSFESTYWDEGNPGRKLEKKKGADMTHMADAATYDLFRMFGTDRLKTGEAGRVAYVPGLGTDEWIRQDKQKRRPPIRD